MASKRKRVTFQEDVEIVQKRTKSNFEEEDNLDEEDKAERSKFLLI